MWKDCMWAAVWVAWKAVSKGEMTAGPMGGTTAEQLVVLMVAKKAAWRGCYSAERMVERSAASKVVTTAERTVEWLVV